MRKTTKAFYAGAAGLALLTASGGSTLALWHDTAPLGTGASNIQTGDLRLDWSQANTELRWMKIRTNGTETSFGTLADLGNVESGDRLIGYGLVDVTLEGTTIVASLSAHTDFPTGLPGSPQISVAIVERGTPESDLRNAPFSAGLTTFPSDFTSSETQLPVVVNIQFGTMPTGSANRPTESLNLGDLYVTLQQLVTESAFRGQS